MPEFSRNRVNVESDLFDLVPVLKESLSAELCEIITGLQEGDFALIREKVHSAKGAALTFGFGVYADELVNLRQAALDCDDIRIQQSIDRLNLLLETSVFVPAG
ncbi:hypothetical protein [Desulfovibrio sp. JC010]|uniref:hypothetical protein n=1 Tax=Desulfovibrio sp. JC010 TaxID=2593641 RepID=UPI0013D59096|nr:hypothetical protein [Desulfovibrio sp. JC010]NDV25046.1 hypothetical protein [Desulfovibrio sp. JC010]